MPTSPQIEAIRTTLLQALEKYLVQEGLLQALPESRRQLYLPPADWPWAATLAIAGLVVSYLAGVAPLIISASVILPLIVFLLARGLIRLIAAFMLPLRWRTIGRIFLSSTSLASGALVAVVLGKAIWFAVYILLTFPSYLLLRAVFRRAPLLTLLSDIWRTFWHALRRTLRALGLLLPLMIVFLLLSVFSSELWQSVGTVGTWQFVGALVLVLGLGIFVATTRTQSAVDSIPDPEPFDPTALVAASFANPPLDSHSEQAAAQDQLYREVSWRYIQKIQARATKTARKRLRWRVIGRLTTSAILLGLIMGGYLWVLFTLLFTYDVIAVFMAKPAATDIAAGITLAKVTLFLVVFIITYFIVQALTEDKVKRELFEDLSVDVENWVRTLMLYDVCLTPGYQEWNTPIVHPSIDTTEIEIVVPAGTTDTEAQEACTQAAQCLQPSPSIVIVTAYERRDSAEYDWDVPGRQWQLICWPHGGGFVTQHTGAEDPRHQHAQGLECERAGQFIPDEWFGFRAHDKVIARKLWQTERTSTWYHVYSCSGPSNLWLFLRLRHSLDSTAAYQALAEEVLEVIVESELTDAFLISISVYIADSPCRLAHVFWRRQPGQHAFVWDHGNTGDAL